MRSRIDNWIDEWFGEGCPPWTWPLAFGGLITTGALAVLFL